MDITLSVVDNPGFTINIQKCTDPAKTSQSMCRSFSQNCIDTSEVPRNTITQCTPGATPKFFVSFTNPLDPKDTAHQRQLNASGRAAASILRRVL